MDRIWAPWRIGYVSKPQGKGCVFCKIRKQKKDKKNLILYRSKHSFVVFNTFPYNNGHLLIVSNKHVKSLKQLSNDQLLVMNKTLIIIQDILTLALKPSGFNIGINLGQVAGAGIKNHLHIHIVPRRKKDGLKGFFWPRQSYRDREHLASVQTTLQATIAELQA